MTVSLLIQLDMGWVRVWPHTPPLVMVSPGSAPEPRSQG
jgi:hypothetical protein